MKKCLIFVCEICGKKSESYEKIRKCEADHLRITLDELAQYKELLSEVASCSYVIAWTKNERTEQELDNAIQKLIDFETKHRIDKQFLPTGL